VNSKTGWDFIYSADRWSIRDGAQESRLPSVAAAARLNRSEALILILLLSLGLWGGIWAIVCSGISR